MYDPKEIFTEKGLREHEDLLYNMEKPRVFLTNNADDLSIGSLDDTLFEVLHTLKKMVLDKPCDGENQDDE